MSSPAICGLLSPVVVVPARILETLAPDKLKAILMHELAHMKRGDLWINSLQTLLQVESLLIDHFTYLLRARPKTAKWVLSMA